MPGMWLFCGHIVLPSISVIKENRHSSDIEELDTIYEMVFYLFD